VINKISERFLYNPDGYPLFVKESQQDYTNSFLKEVAQQLAERKFTVGWGRGNNNVWDFMSALCQYSYLMAYAFIPEGIREEDVTRDNWDNLTGQTVTFRVLSMAAFCDAIDSIARIWFRVWRKYVRWERKRK